MKTNDVYNLLQSKVAFVVYKNGKNIDVWGKGSNDEVINLLAYLMNQSDDIKRIIVKALATTMNAKSINEPKNEGEKDNA